MLAIDLETVPQARFLDPAEYLWRGGLRSPTCEWWKEWWREGMRDDTLALQVLDGEARGGDVPLAATGVVPALHATTCHIVQVSFGWRDSEGIKTTIRQSDEFNAEPGPAERTLLLEALNVIAGAAGKRTTLVSFNGKQFDIPVLRARAALLRLQIPSIPWRRLLYPYSDDQHADLRLILGADDRRARGTLKWWSEAFGVHAEEHGAEVGAWVRAGEWGKLRAYGECEARTLVELFEAVEAVL